MSPRSMSVHPRLSVCLAALCVAGLAACSAPYEAPASDTPASAEPMPIPGSDRDAHGCIASAGYSWCERSGQCERPWELAEQAGFDNTAEAFAQYCEAPDAEAIDTDAADG